MICVSLKGCALDWVDLGEKYWVLRSLMMNSQGGIKGEMLEKMQSLTSKGIDFTSKLLLPSRVEKTAILRHLDCREVVWEKGRKERKLIYQKVKVLLNIQRLVLPMIWSSQPGTGRKNRFPNIWDHTIYSFIGRNPYVEAKISTNWLCHLRRLTYSLWASVSSRLKQWIIGLNQRHSDCFKPWRIAVNTSYITIHNTHIHN